MATNVKYCNRLSPEKVPCSQSSNDQTKIMKDSSEQQKKKGRCGTRKLVKKPAFVLLEDVNLWSQRKEKQEKRKKSHAEELRSEIQDSLFKKRKLLLQCDQDSIKLVEAKKTMQECNMAHKQNETKPLNVSKTSSGKKKDKESLKKILMKKEKDSTKAVRLKREASLNAAAMVNILYEARDSAHVPKLNSGDPEKRKCVSFEINKANKISIKTLSHVKNIKVETKIVEKMKNGNVKKSNMDQICKKSRIKKKCNRTTIDSDYVQRKPKIYSIHSKTKKTFEKSKITADKFVRRIASLNAEAMISAVREQKGRKKFPNQNQDTCKAARTHVTVTPKKWCPAQCRECVQSVHMPSVFSSSVDTLHSCPVGGSSPSQSLQSPTLFNSQPNYHNSESFHNSSVFSPGHTTASYSSTKEGRYWSNQPCVEQQHIMASGETDSCDEHSILIDVTSPCTTPKLQSIDTTPCIKNIIPHRCISTCPTYQCTHIGGVVSSSECQNYTLSGVVSSSECQNYTMSRIGSLSSVHMMSYHQPCNSAFPVSCPHSIHHCGCSACYPLIHASPCLVHHPMPICISSPPSSDIPSVKSQVQVQPANVTTLDQGCAKPRKKSVTEKIKNEKKRIKERREVTEEKKKAPLIHKCISWHGWKWDGEMEIKKIQNFSGCDGSLVEKKCYSAIVHNDGDIIRVRDCVLLASGPKSKDLPYVAKIVTFWEHPETGEMMMHLLWYYRPEHTEGGEKPHYLDCEVFASKHKDENSVACIDDKCYVLTFNEFCRYMASVRKRMSVGPLREKVVPEQEEEYPRTKCLASTDADSESVFLCRQVYDFRQKRVLKNPS